MNPRDIRRLSASLGYLLLFILVASRCAWARSIAVPGDSEFLVQAWESEEGLPQNSITSIVQTRDGYLWFGTFRGLVRFDSEHFKVFDPVNTKELPGTAIVSLHYDQTGHLWISTDRGLVVLKEGIWTPIGLKEGWTGNYMRTFGENRGVISLTSFDGKVAQYKDGRLEPLPSPPGRLGEGYLGSVDEEGRVWVGQNAYLGYWDGGRWNSFPLESGVTNELRALSTARDGTLLALTGSSVWRIRGGRIISRLALSENLGLVWEIREDSRGLIWAGTQQDGLKSISPEGRVVAYSPGQAPVHNAVRSVFEDRERNVWVGTSESGLLRIKDRTVFNYGAETGVEQRNVKALVEESPGQILVGTYGKGFFRVRNDGGTERVIIPTNRNNGIVQTLMVDRDGEVWAGFYGAGLTVYKGDKLAAVPPGSWRFVASIFQDSGGRVWVGDKAEAAYVANGQTHVTKLDSGSPLPDVRCFAEEEGTGAMLAVNGLGLYRLEGVSWREIPGPNGRSVKEAVSVCVDPDGTIWTGSDTEGLLRLKQGRWSQISEAQGLPTRYLSCLLDDGRGYRWLGSNRGVLRVKKQDLDDVADGKAPRLTSQVFDISDGMASSECSSGYQSVATRDSSGRLWFGTLKGAAMIDPARLRINTNPPPIVLDEVSYTDQHGDEHRYSPMVSGRISIPAGAREFGIVFSGLSYSAPEKMRFAYLIEGEGETWKDLGIRRSVYLSTLAPGLLRMKIKGWNNDGVESSVPLALEVVVAPLYWQTIWFRVAAVAGSILSVGFGARALTRDKLQRKIVALQRERALESERARLGAVAEATSDLVSFAAPDGRITFINRAGKRMLGIADDDEPGRYKMLDFLPPRAHDRLWNEALPAVARDSTWTGETEFRALDGREFPVSQVLVAHKSDDGILQFYSMIVRDITASKKIEEALRASEKSYRALVDISPEAIVVSVEDRVVFVNPATLVLLGASKSEELLGRSVLDFVVPEDLDRVKKARQAVQDAGIPAPTVELALQKIGGERTYARIWTVPFDYDGKSAVLNLLMDVSDRKKAEAARDKIEAQLRQAQKMEALGALAGGIAHDFNNILGAVMAYSELAQLQAEGNRNLYENLDEVLKASQRAAALVKQILAFSRQQQMERYPISLEPVAREVVKFLNSTVPSSIEITVHFGTGIGFVNADPSQIHQILMNLCTNAVHAIGSIPGRMTIRTELATVDEAFCQTVTGLKPGVYVRLSVSDTGKGMDADTVVRIFEPFYTTKPVGQGTGLGLSVVHGIVSDHDGAIQVSSQPGKGSTFSVYFPAIEPALRAAVVAPTELPAGRGQHLLFVDDEVSLGRGARKLLERLNYRVTVVTDPLAALALFNEEPEKFDLVMTDLQMPQMTGVNLAAAVTRIRPQMRILLMTGYIGSYTADMLKEAGINDVLNKPLTLASLATAVHKILA